MEKNIRQSKDFANFMEKIGWRIEKINSQFIYLKKIPILGYFLKAPRIKPPIPFLKIENLIKKYRVFKSVIEPNSSCQNQKFYNDFLTFGYKINSSPISPTKTIQINLKKSLNELLNNSSPEKRRTIKKAVKSGLIVKEVNDLNIFLKIRSFLPFFLNFLLDKELKIFFKIFSPQKASLLIAYFKNKPVAGVFLLFSNNISYYWQARSLKAGKKLGAPSLLVFEALKKAKDKGYKIFDFEGIYDERFPIKNWLGFSRFKKGFGGEEIEYLETFQKTKFL